jgi:hypothetical protein
MARLDRAYIFTSTPASLGRQILAYTVKGDTTRSDHFPVFVAVQLEDMPRRTSKWKMSSFHLDAAHPDIVRIWKDQPIGTPFFTKLQRVLQFYRSFCKKRTAEGREDEKALMEELEATTSEVQVNVGDLVAQLAAVSRGSAQAS